jgi:hypothetical protein
MDDYWNNGYELWNVIRNERNLALVVIGWWMPKWLQQDILWTDI